ncbi:hypothetical protein RSAG8_03030, partial [Rhizoctonia solani AG-8 WAC10335]
MSPRKKNIGKPGPFNQSTINNFFPAKSKHASTSTRPKRLAQSSLAARPLRSKRSPDLEEVLDLTHSTSPVRESETPPSAKKRKLRATSPDQSPIRGAQKDPSPMVLSRSTSPTSHIPQNTAESGPSTSVQLTPVSSAPSQTGRSQDMLDIDPDETDAQTPSGAMPSDVQGSNTVNRSVSTPKRQRPTPPASVNTPAKNHVAAANLFTPRFSSPRPIHTPMYPSDMIPSSQGEPSLEATELGTVESPTKPAKYPTVAAALPPFVPSVAPALRDTLHTRPRATTPLLPISEINLDPQTPHRVVDQFPPSSPTDFPSPGRLMSSLGFEASRATNNAPLRDKRPSTLSNANGVEKHTQTHALSVLPHPEEDANNHAPESAASQARGEESPVRSQSSSQTVVPSSQPMHDSSPPPEYDLDPKRHSFNQRRLQSFNQPLVPAQPPAGVDSRFPSNSSRPYFTAQTHQSPSPSSQSLPHSQSPIKGGQFDPNQSAAGVRGVFGMLGFGSEADNQEVQTGDDDEEMNPHIPVTYDLPPSSPPPQTPTRHESRESSPDSYLVPAAKKRSKTATPVRRSAAKVSHTASSPIRYAHPDDMDVDSSPVQDSRSNSKRPTPRTGKIRAGPSGAQSPSLAGRPRKASRATQSKDSPYTRQTRPSMRAQRQKSVDNEIVESSDAEEVEIDVQLSPTFPTSIRATAGAKNSAEPTKPIGTTTPERNRPSTRISEAFEVREHAPWTPAREERLPSSVSPSPIRIRHSPPARTRHSSPPSENTQTQEEAETPWESLRPDRTRHSSPPSENTQTQEEAETPWESLRPDQSVSQVYERQLIEEAERASRLRMEQNAEKQKAKVLVEDSSDIPNGETEEVDRVEPQQQEESLDQEPVRPVMISLDPHSPTNVPNEPPRLALPHSFSTPKTRRTVEKAHYIVTPTRVIRPTPARATPSRKSMTPSSMVGEDEPDEEYTYVEETFNPTESQRSFLNRILQLNGSEIS